MMMKQQALRGTIESLLASCPLTVATEPSNQHYYLQDSPSVSSFVLVVICLVLTARV
jgi:hypothetical protein